MYFNNRNRPQGSVFGCSFFGLIIGLFVLSLIIRGSLYFFFRYFWLIIALAIIVWVFRKFVGNDNGNSKGRDQEEHREPRDWNRDFENRKDTSYHNVDRDFEEVDEEDEFDDF